MREGECSRKTCSIYMPVPPHTRMQQVEPSIECRYGPLARVEGLIHGQMRRTQPVGTLL
jgi:hypothetical protein